MGGRRFSELWHLMSGLTFFSGLWVILMGGVDVDVVRCCLKKNLNASRPSEHSSVQSGAPICNTVLQRPGRRGKVFFVSSLYVRVLQSARFGYRQTEMKHNKSKTNKFTTAAIRDQSQKPHQEHVFSNLLVSGVQGQTEMKHTKFTTNKLTTAAWTKQSRKRQDFKKGFLVEWFWWRRPCCTRSVATRCCK